MRDIARADKCLSSLLYLSTLDNKSENSKKFHSLLLIKCGKLNYQTALSRFQRSAIGSCIALKVIKSNTQIRWKYFICIYLFFRLSEYKEIEFIVKCCYPPSLVCFVIYSTSYRKGQVCFPFKMAVQVSVCECEYFTLPLLLAFRVTSCQPLPIYAFTALLFYFKLIFAIKSFVVPRPYYPGRLIFASGSRGPSKFPNTSPKIWS